MAIEDQQKCINDGQTTMHLETAMGQCVAGAGCRRRPSPHEAPPIGKIHPFSKMAVTFEALMGFDALRDL